MSKLAEITEKIIRSVSGGKDTVDGKVDYLWIESNIPRWRQEAVFLCISGGKNKARNYFLPSELFQTFTITIVLKDQDKTLPYIKATIPSAARIDGAINGSNFVGNALTGIGFSQISTASYASSLLDRGDLNKDIVGYLDVGTETRFYGDKELKEISIVRILANPSDAPNFDIDNSEYPNSNDVETMLIMVAKAELVQELLKPADTISDGVETIEKRAVAQNNV